MRVISNDIGRRQETPEIKTVETVEKGDA